MTDDDLYTDPDDAYSFDTSADTKGKKLYRCVKCGDWIRKNYFHESYGQCDKCMWEGGD